MCSAIFVVQAIARNMIVEGRDHEIEEVRHEIFRTAPEVQELY